MCPSLNMGRAAKRREYVQQYENLLHMLVVGGSVNTGLPAMKQGRMRTQANTLLRGR